jgi:hypothetical protein
MRGQFDSKAGAISSDAKQKWRNAKLWTLAIFGPGGNN